MLSKRRSIRCSGALIIYLIILVDIDWVLYLSICNLGIPYRTISLYIRNIIYNLAVISDLLRGSKISTINFYYRWPFLFLLSKPSTSQTVPHPFIVIFKTSPSLTGKMIGFCPAIDRIGFNEVILGELSEILIESASIDFTAIMSFKLVLDCFTVRSLFLQPGYYG